MCSKNIMELNESRKDYDEEQDIEAILDITIALPEDASPWFRAFYSAKGMR